MLEAARVRAAHQPREAMHAMVAQVAERLPSLSTSDLEHCQRHRPATPLSSCVNLANPASGSSSLCRAVQREPLMFNYSGQARRPIFDAGKDQPSLMHTHALNVRDLHSFLVQTRRVPAPTCFFMTLRDPADRLESAFRESYAHAERLTRIGLGSLPRSERNAITLLKLLRNTSRCITPPTL